MPEQTAALDASPPSHRVKVYSLDETSNWADKGTGFCVYLEGNGDDPDEIFVRSEIDSTPLVSSSVFAERTYHKEGETVILWADVEKNDLALSFEDAEGRDDIWLRICNKRGVDHQTYTLHEVAGDGDGDTVIQIEQTLPTPTKENLGKIVKILENTTTLHEKDELAVFILNDGYVNKLFPIFEACEKANKIKRLHKLFTIMKSIILLNDNTVIEHITNDDNIIPVASILEYDTATPTVKANHREILKAHSHMEPAVSLDDPTTLLKIRQTYRFQYLKDVIMARYLDETLSSMLQSLIVFNHIETLNNIQHNMHFLENIFGTIKRRDTDEIERTKAVQAVLQLCTISKSLQSGSRSQLYRTLARHGLFIPIEIALSSEDPGMRKAGAAALCSIVDMDVSLLRSHILSQQPRDDPDDDDYATDFDDDDDTGNNKRDLLQCIINRFTSEVDSGLKFQYGDILKMTLELNATPPVGALATTKVLRKQTPGIDDILGVFYDKYAPSILQPLMNIENKPMKLDGPITVLEHGRDQGEVYSHLLDFLCFAVQQHSHRSKYWMLSGDCFVKVAQLYRSRLNWVKIAALRFFRVCVGLVDDFYNRHLIKHNVFESTIRLLLDTDGKGNVLNSNCLELLEFIRHENPKLLVSHLIERFGSVLDTVDYISTCSELRKQHHKNQEQLNNMTSFAYSGQSDTIISGQTSNDGNQTTSLDRYEEGYFNESDDEDDQRLDDFGDKIDQFLSSVSPPPSTAKTTASEERRRPLLEETASDDEEDAIAATTEDNTDADPSPPFPIPLKHKRDHEEDDEDDVLAAKASKRLDQDTPTMLKRNPALQLGASDDDDTTNAIDKESHTKDDPSPPLPLRPLKQKHDDDDDDDDDVLAAKASKRSNHDQPSLSKPNHPPSKSSPSSLK